MTQDVIADMLTRIRNAQAANKSYTVMPSSNVKVAIANILHKQGYIHSFSISTKSVKSELTINLSYHLGQPVIDMIKRISRPGRRVYHNFDKFPIVNMGCGISIVSTSRGIMTGQQAFKCKVGGELLCLVS